MGRRDRSSERHARHQPRRHGAHGHDLRLAIDDASPRTTRWMRWGLAGLIILLTVVAFLPALRNNFVMWDDDDNFLNNPYYRGLGWPRLAWMWTTSHMGHYIPLTWMTLGLDYTLWGMNPAGYHATNLLLHTANALLVFFFTVRMLALALPGEAREPRAVWISAAVGALLFAIHPLRVESVVWITERRDVLCGLFTLATLLSYLRAHDAPQVERRWYRLSIVLYGCALLSKSIAVPLAAVLLVLDAYPLRRLGGSVGWWSAGARRVYAEKIPFVALAAATSGVAFWALQTADNAPTLDQLGVPARIAVSAYGLAFYLWKTLVPVNLSPLYEFPARVDPFDLRFVLSGGTVLAVTALAIALRRRFPALLAVWATYALVLLPVLGFFQNGPQMAADRYTYLPMLAWTVLASAALARGWQAWQARPLPAGAVALALVVVIVALGALTWRQALVWRSPETLWRHAISVDASSAVAHSNLSAALERDGKLAEAIQESERALRIRPRFAAPHVSWGNALVGQGRFAEAMEHYVAALRIDPDDADAHNNLGAAMIKHAEPAETLKSYFRLMAAMSYSQEVKHVRDIQAELAEAIEHFRQALRIRPDYAAAHANWAIALTRQGKEDEANEHFAQARHLASATTAPTRTWRRVAKAKQRRLPQLRPTIPPSVRWDAVTVLASRFDADDDHRWKFAEAGVARGAGATLGALARTG